eukprot:8914406-Heterocapsa_arctica.AAC.1
MDQQLLKEQERHCQEFAHRQAKGKGNRIKGGVWMEGNQEHPQEDAGMGDNQHAEEADAEIGIPA